MRDANHLKQLIVLALYVACFADGTAAHLSDVLRFGWQAHHLDPVPLRAFWTALAILDPTVIALLLLGWRRTGLLLALGIMLADVSANSYAALLLHDTGFGVALPLQCLFLGFVLGSFAFLWPPSQRNQRDS